MKNILLFLLIICTFCIFSENSHSKTDIYSRGLVITELKLPNKFKVAGAEFKTLNNPKGEGVIVYDPRTQFNGVERYFIWMVIDHKIYPLNSPSKQITPHLQWPREAPQNVWSKTNLSPYSTSELIKIIYK